MEHVNTKSTLPRRGMTRLGGVAALVAACLLLVPLLTIPAVRAGAAAASPETEAAIAWMDEELAANDGRFPGWLEGTVDWGLMADFALARIATGHADDAATRAQAQVLLDNLGTYSTWDDQPDKPGVRSSGALAKVYLVALGAGLETTDVDGVNLETEMRSLMQTTGDQAGRFSDRNPYGPDYSLALGQSWAMMALAHTTGGVPAQSLTFLVDQQCPAGGFRLVFESTPGCDDDAEADPDATALAVQVLLGVERSADLEAVLSKAVTWLVGRQQADGSFGGGKWTEAPNANSTGLIAQALRAAGRTEQAEAAEAWVVTNLQVGADAAGTPAAGEVGVIAYDPAARTAALADGIADGGRDQWRRATAQGVLALGAGLFVEVVATSGGPDGSTTTTSTTTTSTSTTVVQAGPTPTLGTAVVLSDSTGGSPSGGVATTPSGSGGTDATLAMTGSTDGPLAALAVTLVALGAVAIGFSARMERGKGESVAR